MFFAEEFLDMMTDTVTISALLGRDRYAQPTYGPARTYPSRINFETHQVVNKDGQTVDARGVVWIACIDPVGGDDKVTFPDGTEPVILAVAQGSDENGPAYTKISFQ